MTALPTRTSSVRTYSDGEVVAWDDVALTRRAAARTRS
jgi:hypothetical protein